MAFAEMAELFGLEKAYLCSKPKDERGCLSELGLSELLDLLAVEEAAQEAEALILKRASSRDDWRLVAKRSKGLSKNVLFRSACGKLVSSAETFHDHHEIFEWSPVKKHQEAALAGMQKTARGFWQLCEVHMALGKEGDYEGRLKKLSEMACTTAECLRLFAVSRAGSEEMWKTLSLLEKGFYFLRHWLVFLDNFRNNSRSIERKAKVKLVLLEKVFPLAKTKEDWQKIVPWLDEPVLVEEAAKLAGVWQ